MLPYLSGWHSGLRVLQKIKLLSHSDAKFWTLPQYINTKTLRGCVTSFLHKTLRQRDHSPKNADSLKLINKVTKEEKKLEGKYKG